MEDSAAGSAKESLDPRRKRKAQRSKVWQNGGYFHNCSQQRISDLFPIYIGTSVVFGSVERKISIF